MRALKTFGLRARKRLFAFRIFDFGHWGKQVFRKTPLSSLPSPYPRPPVNREEIAGVR